MYKILVGILLGLVVGVVFYKISILLIQGRTPSSEKIILFKRKYNSLLYVSLSALSFGLIAYVTPDLMTQYERMLLFSICLSIAWIDILIRKIPNELLMALILNKVIFLILHHQFGSIVQGIVGMAVGFFVFMLPSLLKIPIGAGDIKYAAVVGFYLGVYSFIQVMLIMALTLLFTCYIC